MNKLNLRILIMLNPSNVDKITHKFLLTKDSGFNLVRSTIMALNKIEDWHFYLLTPPECMEEVRPLFPNNVTLVPYPYMNDALNSRFHFDTNSLNSYFNNYKHDIDMAWTMLPEHAGALKAFFNKRREEIPVFSYICWMDYKQTKGYEPSYLLRMVDGINSSDAVGIQSRHMKDFMTLNLLWRYRDIVDLSKAVIITPKTEIPDEESKIGDVIGFNHRISTESYFKEMFELCKDKLKFKLWVSNLNNVPLEEHPMLLEMSLSNHDEYYKFLSLIRFGISYHIGYSMWSMSVLDMMAVGKVVLVPYKNAFPEMFPEDYPFFFSDEEEFLEKLEYLQNCPDEVLEHWGNLNRVMVEEMFTWDLQAKEISHAFYGMIRDEEKPNRKISSVMREITRYGAISKGDLINKNLTDFSRQCSRAWNRVRIQLMNLYGIKDDMSSEHTLFYLPDYDIINRLPETPKKRPTNYDIKRMALKEKNDK